MVLGCRAYSEDGDEAQRVSDIVSLESRYGNLPLVTRVMLAFYRVLYGLAFLLVCMSLYLFFMY